MPLCCEEKDLDDIEYQNLAVKVKEICDNHQVNLIINQNIETAERLNIGAVQLSID